VTPAEVLGRWYDAHRAGDMDAARSVFADGAAVRLPDRTLHGFDAFLAFSADRRATRPAFAMSVVDTMAGEGHVAVLLELTEHDRRWRQLALYTVADDRITEIWTVEE
jgi:hypothetical protein